MNTSDADGVYFFAAELRDTPGVTLGIEILPTQRLTDLHGILRAGFGWGDDHLYSFWLGDEFWAGADCEYTSPVDAEQGVGTADIAVRELGLQQGDSLAYIFDFGDEWRVRLSCLNAEPRTEAHSAYPRIVEREGTPPPQYE